jgi:hypothetical protein
VSRDYSTPGGGGTRPGRKEGQEWGGGSGRATATGSRGGGLVPERRPKKKGGATTVERCWRGYSGRKTPQITILPVAGRANSAGNGSPSGVLGGSSRRHGGWRGRRRVIPRRRLKVRHHTRLQARGVHGFGAWIPPRDNGLPETAHCDSDGDEDGGEEAQETQVIQLAPGGRGRGVGLQRGGWTWGGGRGYGSWAGGRRGA